jgi:hypothetical protein
MEATSVTDARKPVIVQPETVYATKAASKRPGYWLARRSTQDHGVAQGV